MRTRPQRSSGRVSRRAHPANGFRRARLQRGQEDGFTIVETVVTLFVMSILIGLVFGFITNLFQQSVNVRDTMAGVQQDQTAGEGLLQYLHAAIVILPGSNATTLDASILEGVTSGTPQTATYQAELIPPAGPGLDATFQTSLVPNGGYCPIPPATPNPACRSINDYDVVNSSTVFTYYYVPSSGSGTPTTGACPTPAGFSSTTAPTSAELSQIVAVCVDVTFLAGPQKPTQGFQADLPTTFETTIYLQNASGAPAPTSTVAVTASSPLAAGFPLTLTALVSPTPDGGYVTFDVNMNGSSYCTSAVSVNTSNGTAACTFTPTSGTYNVSATFSGSFTGSSDYQASSSPVTQVVVPEATTNTSLNVTPSSGQLAITATVTATDGSTPTGSVGFVLTGGSCPSGGCTSTVPLNASGKASWTPTGLSNSITYTITANFSDPTQTYASSTATTTGRP